MTQESFEQSKDAFRTTLGISAAMLALAGATYVSTPAELRTDVRDTLGFATEGVSHSVVDKSDGFSDLPEPVTHDNADRIENGAYHPEATAIPTPAGETYTLRGDFPVARVEGR